MTFFQCSAKKPMSESDLQRKCIQWLEKEHRHDIAYANIHGGGWSAKGFPDLILCIKGMFCAFELKVKDNKQQADQRIWQKRIQRAKGFYFTPYTFEEFKAIVEGMNKDDQN